MTTWYQAVFLTSSTLAVEDPNERLGVSERVVDWMMIVFRSAEPLPSLRVSEITD